jgi:hypothetical protein
VPGSPPSWTAARRRTRHGWRPNSRGAGPRQACRQPRPEAHRSLGTAEAVTGLYRAEAEEESLIQDLLRGRSVDESLDTRRSGTDGEDAGLDDFLADFFRPVGEEAHRRTLWRPVAALPPWSRRAAEPPQGSGAKQGHRVRGDSCGRPCVGAVRPGRTAAGPRLGGDRGRGRSVSASVRTYGPQTGGPSSRLNGPGSSPVSVPWRGSGRGARADVADAAYTSSLRSPPAREPEGRRPP